MYVYIYLYAVILYHHQSSTGFWPLKFDPHHFGPLFTIPHDSIPAETCPFPGEIVMTKAPESCWAAPTSVAHACQGRRPQTLGNVVLKLMDQEWGMDIWMKIGVKFQHVSPRRSLKWPEKVLLPSLWHAAGLQGWGSTSGIWPPGTHKWGLKAVTVALSKSSEVDCDTAATHHQPSRNHGFCMLLQLKIGLSCNCNVEKSTMIPHHMV